MYKNIDNSKKLPPILEKLNQMGQNVLEGKAIDQILELQSKIQKLSPVFSKSSNLLLRPPSSDIITNKSPSPLNTQSNSSISTTEGALTPPLPTTSVSNISMSFFECSPTLGKAPSSPGKMPLNRLQKLSKAGFLTLSTESIPQLTNITPVHFNQCLPGFSISLDSIIIMNEELRPNALNLIESINQSGELAKDPTLSSLAKNALKIKRKPKSAAYFIPGLQSQEISRLANLSIEEKNRFILENVQTLAVFKPSDEVRGEKNHQKSREEVICSKEGVSPSCEIPNEVITAGLRSLPFVVIEAEMSAKEIFMNANTKRGVLVQFIPHLKTPQETVLVKDFQMMAFIDLSLLNTDRNQRNILFSNENLYPIDHANILPSKFLSSGWFEWRDWAIAKKTFEPEFLEKIEKLNVDEDIEKIKHLYPNYPSENLEILKYTYYLLKKGAGAGLSPFQFASILMAENPRDLFSESKIQQWYEEAPIDEKFSYVTAKIDEEIQVFLQ